MSELPPYSVDPPVDAPTASSVAIINNRIAGIVNTTSILDQQVDYVKIVSETSLTYSISLTVDPSPIFRIEFSSNIIAAGDILIYPAYANSSSSQPLAAAKFTNLKNPKSRDPIAQICTASPHLPTAKWRSLVKGSSLQGEDYKCSAPIVTVPGVSPTMKSFTWRTSITPPHYELWWDGLLPSQAVRNLNHYDFRALFATFTPRALSPLHEHMMQYRRGGGLEFELSAILGAVAIYSHINRKRL